MKYLLGCLFLLSSFITQAQEWELLRDYKLDYHAVDFANDSTVIAVGRGRHLTKSGDRGKSWNRPKLDTNSAPHTITDVHFIDDRRGYFIGQNILAPMIYKTTDGGEYWNAIGDKSSVAFGHRIYFSANRKGFYFDAMGSIRYTENDFKSLTTPLVFDSVDINNPNVHWSFSSPDTGFIYANSTKNLYTTHNGGKSFTQVNTSDMALRNIVCISSDVVIALGTEGCFISKNGGSTWTAMKGDTSVTKNLTAGVYSTKRNIIFACGRRGILAHIDMVGEEVLLDTMASFKSPVGGYVDISLSPDEATVVAVGTVGHMAVYSDPSIGINELPHDLDLEIVYGGDRITVGSTAGISLGAYIITGLDGKTIGHGNANGMSRIEIPIANLRGGAFVLRINSDQGTFTKKIFVR